MEGSKSGILVPHTQKTNNRNTGLKEHGENLCAMFLQDYRESDNTQAYTGIGKVVGGRLRNT